MSTPAVVAVLLAAFSVMLLGGAGSDHVRRRTARGTVTRTLLVLTLGSGIAGASAALSGSHLVLALLGSAIIAAVVREAGRRRRAAEASRRADQVLALCDGLAADLRSGLPPVAALDAAVREWPELTPVLAAARLGSDVPDALRRLAAQPGAAQLRVVAASWQVAHRSGGGLAGALAMAADELRDDRATARVVATELAAAQATARLLAVLPVVVLVLGSGVGGDPLGFLLRTSAGLVCLCTGLGLVYAGLCWLDHVGRQVVEGSR